MREIDDGFLLSLISRLSLDEKVRLLRQGFVVAAELVTAYLRGIQSQGSEPPSSTTWPTTPISATDRSGKNVGS